MSERLGFDNARHPDYQSVDIDREEEAFRQNDRMVYHASEQENEVRLLFQ